MSARILLVEITPGVTCSFAFGRVELVTQSVSSPRAEPQRDATPEQRNRSYGPRSPSELDALVGNLLRRVDRLEQITAAAQPLLDLDDPDSKPKRTNRSPVQKR